MSRAAWPAGRPDRSSPAAVSDSAIWPVDYGHFPASAAAAGFPPPTRLASIFVPSAISLTLGVAGSSAGSFLFSHSIVNGHAVASIIPGPTWPLADGKCSATTHWHAALIISSIDPTTSSWSRAEALVLTHAVAPAAPYSFIKHLMIRSRRTRHGIIILNHFQTCVSIKGLLLDGRKGCCAYPVARLISNHPPSSQLSLSPRNKGGAYRMSVIVTRRMASLGQ